MLYFHRNLVFCLGRRGPSVVLRLVQGTAGAEGHACAQQPFTDSSICGAAALIDFDSRGNNSFWARAAGHQAAIQATIAWQSGRFTYEIEDRLRLNNSRVPHLGLQRSQLLGAAAHVRLVPVDGRLDSERWGRWRVVRCAERQQAEGYCAVCYKCVHAQCSRSCACADGQAMNNMKGCGWSCRMHGWVAEHAACAGHTCTQIIHMHKPTHTHTCIYPVSQCPPHCLRWQLPAALHGPSPAAAERHTQPVRNNSGKQGNRRGLQPCWHVSKGGLCLYSL